MGLTFIGPYIYEEDYDAINDAGAELGFYGSSNKWTASMRRQAEKYAIKQGYIQKAARSYTRKYNIPMPDVLNDLERWLSLIVGGGSAGKRWKKETEKVTNGKAPGYAWYKYKHKWLVKGKVATVYTNIEVKKYKPYYTVVIYQGGKEIWKAKDSMDNLVNKAKELEILLNG